MAKTAAGLVAHHPRPEDLQRFAATMGEVPNIDQLAIWFNSPIHTELRAASQNPGQTELLGGQDNLGMAEALNQLAQWALSKGCTQLIVFDQDSQMTQDNLSALLDEFEQKRAEIITEHNKKILAMGPRLIDARTEQPMRHYAPYDWVRRPLDQTMQADHLISSAMVFDLIGYRDVGPFAKDYFIDLVDVEWCLRARQKGYELYVARQAQMQQSIGQQTRVIAGRSVYLHAPHRHFYQVRNALWLIKSGPISWGRRINELYHLVVRMGYLVILANQRWVRFIWSLRGAVVGLVTSPKQR